MKRSLNTRRPVAPGLTKVKRQKKKAAPKAPSKKKDPTPPVVDPATNAGDTAGSEGKE